MQVFKCRDLIHLNIICVRMETVLSLIREDWMLWLLGAGSKLTLLVAALLPRGANLDPASTNHNFQSARIKLNTVSICTQIMLRYMRSQHLNTCILY